VIDLHAHVLPGVDDGPQSLEDAAAMATVAAAAGTTVIAATSHVDSRWRRDPAELEAARAEVTEIFAAAGVQVVAGGEIAMDRFLDLDDAALGRLALGGSHAVLVEPPFNAAIGGLEPLVRSLQERGWRVVLAHPERCAAFQGDLHALQRLLDTGVLAQITAPSLIGAFGRVVERTALELVRTGRAHLLASDAHDTQRRPPDLRPAVAVLEKVAPGLSRWLVQDVPAALLADTELPPRPLTPSRSGWRRRSR